MAPKVERTHDLEIYLNEERYQQPKEIFKVLVRRIQETGLLETGGTLCDMGCATGEFLYYARQHFPAACLLGVDVMPQLIARAREMVPGVEFQVGSVRERDTLPVHSVDVMVMQGVMSIFDDFETTLDNLLAWTRPGGRIYVFGLVNPWPVDVWIKIRRSDDPDPEHREPGWNIFSRASLGRFLDERLGPGRHRFTPFEMPFDLEPHPDDPVRSWTFRDASGRRLFTNGLCLLLNLEILEIWP